MNRFSHAMLLAFLLTSDPAPPARPRPRSWSSTNTPWSAIPPRTDCRRARCWPWSRPATAISGWAPTRGWPASTATPSPSSTKATPRKWRATASRPWPRTGKAGSGWGRRPGCCATARAVLSASTAARDCAAISSSAFSWTASGTLWVGTTHGLHRWDNDRFQAFTTAQGLSSNYITSLADDGAGGLWIGTGQGLNHLQQRQDPGFQAPATACPTATSAPCYLDRQGTLWIGTSGGGLITCRRRPFRAA